MNWKSILPYVVIIILILVIVLRPGKEIVLSDAGKHEKNADSLAVVIEDLQIQAVKDSLIIDAYATNQTKKLDSITRMSTSDLYRVWSGGREIRFDTSESLH